jgi:selenide,water dikinase
MKDRFNFPAMKQLVLLGGGHSHLAVLMHLARNPLPGLDLTLVSREIETPYSGALPAFIEGRNCREELFIDLRPLAQMAGARLIQANVQRLDINTQKLYCSGRPPINFDLLSLNIGSQPDSASLPGAAEFATAVKPIPEFLQRWEHIQQELLAKLATGQNYTLVIIGGGPASVELACSMHTRLQQRLISSTVMPQASKFRIVLISGSTHLLGDHTSSAGRFALRALEKRGIETHLGCRVVSIEKHIVHFSHRTEPPCSTTAHEQMHADAIIVATGASPAGWLKDTGLSLDSSGFIHVNDKLQSLSHPFVFAAGDIASIAGQARSKSGVYAVRQGVPLARNLCRYATGKPLKSYRPQTHALALLSMGDGSAIASRGKWSIHAAWVYQWKHWIDQRFTRRYNKISPPAEAPDENNAPSRDAPLASNPKSLIRCAGCAAKLGSSMLQDVLANIKPCTHQDILSSLAETEDTSIIRLGQQRVLLQTVDHFRAFIKDPYLFARIATVHCLSDIHAMGATAHSALAIVSIPHAATHIKRAWLTDIMSGSTEVLNAHNTALIGGHTGEADQLSFGLSITAFADPKKLLRKSGMQSGDALILCKPLGTGTLLAADMRYQARHLWISTALDSMQRSNQWAAHCFVKYGAHACTDITGFGLLGHLREMMETERCHVTLDLTSIPALDGALQCLEKGYFSSLHSENARYSILSQDAAKKNQDVRVQLLFDPQTSGGLLAAVPQHQAEACLAELHTSGYREARRIGTVIATGCNESAIELTN